MIKYANYIMVTLFPAVAFNVVLGINYKLITGYKQVNLTLQHTMLYGLIIAIIMYCNFKLIVKSIKKEDYYPEIIIISAILGLIMFLIVPFVPAILNRFPEGVRKIYYHNISLNIAVALNLITTYTVIYIKQKVVE